MSVPSALFVIAIAAAGCGGPTPASPEVPRTPVGAESDSSREGTTATLELRFDETVEYQDVELRWLKIEDSRCPTGVTCIWAGQIIITVEMVRAEEEPVEIKLLLRVGDSPETSRVFDYELRLESVNPHPKEGVTPERSSYMARIEIAKP